MPHRVNAAEFARLSSLYRYGILDTEAEPAVDLALQVLAARLDVPVAQLVFADARRFWAKGTVGPVVPVIPRGRGPLDDLVTEGAAFLATDAFGADYPLGSLALCSFAGLRIVSPEDEVLGAIYVADTRPRGFAAEAADALGTAALEIQALLDSGRRHREDALTGALQRDAFLDQARRLIEVTRVGRQSISLVTLDLSPLRAALESKAPGLGSLAVRHMADLGRTQVRRRDGFGRLDEDRFAVVLTDTAEAGARVLAQRLSRHVERGWTDAGLAVRGLELGIGAMKPAGAGDTVEALMARAATTRWTAPDAQVTARVA